MLKYSLIAFPLINSITTYKITPYSKLTSCWTPRHHSPLVAQMASQSLAALRCLKWKPVVQWNLIILKMHNFMSKQKQCSGPTLFPQSHWHMMLAEEKVNTDERIGALKQDGWKYNEFTTCVKNTPWVLFLLDSLKVWSNNTIKWLPFSYEPSHGSIQKDEQHGKWWDNFFTTLAN